MKKIIVIDDHTIFRQGIIGLLKSVDGVEVIAEAGTGTAAVMLAENHQPDLIIMDIELPELDGIEAAKKIKAAGIKTSIIILTMHKEAELIAMASEEFIDGYLLKDDAFDELVYAIRAVLRGERFISSSLGEIKDKPLIVPAFTDTILTKREREIVSLVAEGLSNKEVAKRLFISVKTVEAHRSHIMKKLGLKSLAELVRYAVKAGIVSL
ncbi:MAG: response regulator [Candidatus Anammoxibacter sp.]